MKTSALEGDILALPGDTLVLGQFGDERPLLRAAGRLDWLLNAALSRLWRARPALFSFGGMAAAVTGGRVPAPRAVVVGLGEKGRFDRERRVEAFRVALRAAAGMGARQLLLEAFPLGDGHLGAVEEDLALAARAEAGIALEVTLVREGVVPRAAVVLARGGGEAA